MTASPVVAVAHMLESAPGKVCRERWGLSSHSTPPTRIELWPAVNSTPFETAGVTATV